MINMMSRPPCYTCGKEALGFIYLKPICGECFEKLRHQNKEKFDIWLKEHGL